MLTNFSNNSVDISTAYVTKEYLIDKIIPFNEFLGLFLALLGYHMVSIISLYSKILAEDPLAGVQLIVALFSAITSYYSSLYFGIEGVVVGLMLLILVFYLPIGIYIVRSRTEAIRFV